jgi:copper resistance protein B
MAAKWLVLAVAALALVWPTISNGQTAPRTAPLPPCIPPITDEDRRVAFPDVTGHTVHDNAINYFVLFDQLEWQAGSGVRGVNWDTTGWVGRDLDRFWFRTDGHSEGGRIGDAYADLLYGRAIARWWDVVAGVRQDVRPGPARTWAAIGIQGLAPYWFEVEATAYVGAGGRTHFRFESEYELLLSNRLILQPLVEVEVYGKSDPERGIGAGLSTADAGLRIRYEFRREFAPYVGVTWQRKFFGTADAARAAGEKGRGTRLAVGLRFWL